MAPGTHDVCDTPISHLPSATPAAVMSLNRKGIATVGELLAASFDEVAYQLDSFDEAELLIKEAQAVSEHSDQGGGEHPPQPDHAPPPAAPESQPSPPPVPARPEGGQVGLAVAMQAVLSLDGGAFASMEASSAAAQRLAAASLIIQYGGGEEEAVAAGMLDTIDPNAPCVDRQDASVRFGEPAVDLLERAELLLTVPMSPTGRPSNVHAKLVEVADRSALLVAACGAVAAARAVLARHQSAGEGVWKLFTGGRDFATWYFGSIAKALGPALKKADREALSHELWSAARALEATGGEGRSAA